jgi:autotransporter translocation and assembly factor TamB
VTSVTSVTSDRRSRVLRALGRTLGGLGLVVTFVAAGTAGVVLHADLPLTRRLGARIAGQALSDVLGGTVVFDTFWYVGPNHLTVPHATLLDAYSAEVLVLSDVRADLSVRRILEELLFDRVRPAIVLEHLRVERADVTLIADPKTGQPTIVRAITPSPSEQSSAGSPERGFRFYMPAIEIGLVTAHGQLAGRRALEAQVHGVHGLLLATPKGLAVDVKRFGMVLRGFGADARGTGTLAVRAPGPVRGTFEGFFGDVELKASAFLEGAHVEASMDVPRASAAAASRLLPGWPLRDAVSAHVEVRGDLPVLEARVVLGAGPATIEAAGPIQLSEPQSATLTVKSRHLDARLLFAGSPPTDLAVDATVAARIERGFLVAEAKAHTDPTLIAGQPIPAMDVEATWKDDSASGTAHVHEPGLPLIASFHATKDGVVDIDADTGGVNLSRLPRLPVPGLKGTARAKIRAHVEAGSVRASVDGNVTGLSAAGARVEHARVTAQVSGKIDALEQVRGSLHVAGTGASFAAIPADTVTLDAHGGAKELEFDAHAARAGGPELHATGRATLAEKVLLQATKISLRQDPVVIEGEIEQLDLAGGRVDIRNVHVAGAGGTLTGSIRLGRDLVEVEAEGENVDLDALGRALGLSRGTLGGRMRISATVVAGHDVTRGRVRLGLGNATLGAVGGLSAQVSADLDEDHFTGSASGLVAGLGTFGTTWDTELGGPAFEPESWRDVTGHSEIQIGNIRLPLLAALLPRNGPVTRVGGQAFARVLLERKTAKEPFPNLFATAATRELTIDIGSEDPKVHVSGIDVTATGALNGTTGDATGTTVAADSHGELLAATGALRVDIERLLRDPRAAFAQLIDTPVDMVVSLPARKVSDLPELVRPTGLSGSVGGNVSVRGTFQKPTLFVSIDGKSIAAEGVSGGHPVDLHGNGEYEWNSHALNARGTAGVGGHTVATASLRGTIPGGRPESWIGDGTVDVEGMPLDLAFASAKNDVTGQLFGHASIRRGAGTGSLEADMRLADLAVESSPLGDGRLQIATTGDVVHANLDLTGERGSLEADASAGVSFSAAVPEFVATAPVTAHVVAHELNAVVLSPFVRSVFARVGGRIDADVTVSVDPHPGANGTKATWTGGIRGSATLAEGSALIDLLGLDIRDLGLAAEARGQGKTTTVSIRDVHGRVRSTKDNVHGSADLVLDGVRVERGTGQLTVDEVPLLFRGAPQGHVTGQAALRLSRESGWVVVDVDLPKLTTRLPQSSSRNVIDLSDNREVTVIQLARDDSDSSPGTKWRLVLHLGQEVRVQRSDLDLGVTGTPTVELGSAVGVDGSIELTPGGRVPVLGKVFVVDHGRLIFDTGEPENPRLDVSASWRAPNGTVVSVDVTGTLKEAKIVSRSDPPLPKAEVDALLLGGSSSESGATTDPNASGSGAAAGAVALGTGVAALGVNELLSNNPVEVRVESTSESRPRYTAAVRVRENLWFEASTYQQTDHSASTGTDRSVYSGTIDYRFRPRWSLRTEAGTAGGAMDLLWQYRY